MKKTVVSILTLFGIVACVNVGGGSSSTPNAQSMTKFQPSGQSGLLTAPVSMNSSNAVNPDVAGANACYMVNNQNTFLYYNTSCYNVAIGSGSAVSTSLVPALQYSQDVTINAALDESNNAYFGIKGQANSYMIKCSNVNSGSGTCSSSLTSESFGLPNGATVVKTSSVMAARNSLVNDSFGRIYTIATCPVGPTTQGDIPPNQQCIFVSIDGAKTWTSITNAQGHNYSQLKFSNILTVPSSGVGNNGMLVVRMSYLDQTTKTTQTNLVSTNVPSTTGAVDSTSYSWGAWASQDATLQAGAAINPNTGILYSYGTPGAYYSNTPGYIVYFGHNMFGPNPPMLWQSESVWYNDPSLTSASSVTGLSIDNASHIFITLSDGTAYWTTTPNNG